MYFVAVDPSIANTGIAVFDFDEKLIFSCTIKTNSKDEGWERRRDLVDNLAAIIDSYFPCALIIEDQFLMPGPKMQTNAMLKLSKVSGAMEAIYCWKHQAERKIVQWVMPREANKAIGIKGRLKRKELKKATKARVQYLYPKADIKTQDAYDAVAIGKAGMQTIKKDMILNKLKKVDKV